MVNVIAFVLDIVACIGMYSILTLSLSLEYGFTGVSNFGKVTFFMIGAYTSAMLTMSGAPYPIGFVSGVILSGLVGTLMSLPALRLKPDYLAILLLVSGEFMRLILKNEAWIAGGPVGLKGVPSAFPVEVGSYETFLVLNVALVYGILLVFYFLSWSIVNSPYGRVIRGIREDELATQMLGKNTLRYKMQIIAISSAMAGASGSLFAQYIHYVGPELFLPEVTFTAFVMSILGGSANLSGAFLGTMILQVLVKGLRIAKDYLGVPIEPNNLMFILMGISMVIILMKRPEGILRERRIKTAK